MLKSLNTQTHNRFDECVQLSYYESTMGNEPTIQDVLEAVNAASSATEGRFSELKYEMGSMKSEMATKADLATMATKADLNRLELKIIDAMDEKLGDLKGDLIVLMRKEDKKVTALIGLLTERKIISMDDAKQLLGMEPFPQISL